MPESSPHQTKSVCASLQAALRASLRYIEARSHHRMAIYQVSLKSSRVAMDELHRVGIAFANIDDRAYGPRPFDLYIYKGPNWTGEPTQSQPPFSIEPPYRSQPTRSHPAQSQSARQILFPLFHNPSLEKHPP